MIQKIFWWVVSVECRCPSSQYLPPFHTHHWSIIINFPSYSTFSLSFHLYGSYPIRLLDPNLHQAVKKWEDSCCSLFIYIYIYIIYNECKIYIYIYVVQYSFWRLEDDGVWGVSRDLMVIFSLKLPWISRLIWTCRLAVFRKVGMRTERGGFPRLGPAGATLIT